MTAETPVSRTLAMWTLAWAALAFDLVVIVTGTVLDVIGPPKPFDLNTQLVNVFSVSIVSFAVLGALMVARRPNNQLAWVFVGIAFVHALGYLMASLAGYLVFRDPTPDRTGVIFAWLFIWTANLHYVPSGTFVFLLFPDGRLPSRRWRPLAVLTLVSIAGLAVGTATLPGPLVVFTTIDNPFGVAGPLPIALAGISFLLASGCALASVASLFVRYRGATGDERQQIKWFLYGGALDVAVVAVTVSLGVSLTSATVLASGATIALAAAAGVAIFRYHLYDIDRLINRTLVYGLTSAGLAVAFFVGVVVLQAVLRPLTSGSEIAVAGSTLGTVALFQPFRQRAQASVDRRFYRSRYDATRMVEEFTARLRDQVDLDAIRTDLLRTVAETVQPALASVWLRPGFSHPRNDLRTPGR